LQISEIIRRMADICIAFLALIVLSPLLLLTLIAVVLESPGNPFYRAWRAGKDGIPFRMWKFRSMVPDADHLGGCITAPRDARITRVGRFIRSTKIDELPQFVNLLVGDLTLVGPRPEDPKIVKRYSDEQRQTLKVKPGITGPGTLYYTTDQFEAIPLGVETDEFYVEHLLEKKLRIDLDYLKNRTIASDFGLVLQTIAVMARTLTNATRES
jgi:lipopolysaccharide/colanic/teichoic acid biosynthesis glycosyltransferase